MKQFQVPTRESVSAGNRAIFDELKSKLGFVPNIYATYAYSENALGQYLSFSSGKTSLSNKEKEAIFLVVSQVNNCSYCQAGHTAIGKMNGFTDEQIIEIRKGAASFDSKLDALVKLAKAIIENREKILREKEKTIFDDGVIVLFSAFEPPRLKFHLKSKQELLLLAIPANIAFFQLI